MQKRLLFVVNDAGFFLSHRLNIAHAASVAGWEVHVATPNGPHVPQVETEGFFHHVFGLSRCGTNPFIEVQSLWALLKLFRSIRPTIVHAVTIKPVIYAGLVAPLAGVPALVQAVSGLGHVFVSHGLVACLRRSFVRAAYWLAFRHQSSRVIFQNPDDQRVLGRAVRRGQTVLIPGAGVDPDDFCLGPEPEGSPVVVFASRMLWAKGVGEFVDAARQLRDKGTSARFVMVGDSDPGNPAAVTESQLLTWAESGVVEWWGYRNDMADVFAGSHVVCLPSYREGLPRVLIEAAACGRPIVTTDVPGCREIVREGENGFLVPPCQSTVLAEALERLILDRELRARMGARSRQKFLERFTTEHVIEETLSVYDALMAETGVRGTEESAFSSGNVEENGKL